MGINNANSDGLRRQACDFIRQSGKIDPEIIRIETNKDIETYCKEMENTAAWGGEPEIYAISEQYEIIICVVKINSEKQSASICPYSLCNTYENCCYIILEHNHYEPLVLLHTGNDANDKVGSLKRDDNNLKIALYDFLQENYPGKSTIRSIEYIHQ